MPGAQGTQFYERHLCEAAT